MTVHHPTIALEESFERRAEHTLRLLEKRLCSFDPDEIDPDLASDVLTITVLNRDKIIINRHRAARQIWVAAMRKAWHFNEDAMGLWTIEKTGEELWTTVESVLSSLLGKNINIQPSD